MCSPPKELSVEIKEPFWKTESQGLNDVLLVFVSFSADFWSALGGKKEYQTSKSLQNMLKPPRLFGCSNKTGRLIVSQRNV